LSYARAPGGLFRRVSTDSVPVRTAPRRTTIAGGPPERCGYRRRARYLAKSRAGTPGFGLRAVGYGTVQRDVAQLG
jgi:hypothetical protein